MRAFVKHAARRQAVREAVRLVESDSPLPPISSSDESSESLENVSAPASFAPEAAFEYSLWISPDRKLDLARGELFLRLLSGARSPLVFEISGNISWIRFALRGNKEDEEIVRHAFQGLYADCALERDQNDWWRLGEFAIYGEAVATNHHARITMPDTLTDSLLWMLTEWLLSIENAVGFYQCVIQSLGPSNWWHRHLEVRHDLAFLERLVSAQTSSQRVAQQVPSGDLHGRSAELAKRVDPDRPFYSVTLRVGVLGKPKTDVGFPQFLPAVRCSGSALQWKQAEPPRDENRKAFFRCGGFASCPLLLNSAELTVFVHLLPPREDLLERTDWPVYRGQLPDAVVGSPGSSIGQINHTGRAVSAVIPWGLRDRAVEIVANPGHGKTTTMKHIFLEDVKTGSGAVFLDPHGDAVKDLALLIPEKMRDRIVYLNPGDPAWVPCWNPLAISKDADPARIADNFVSAIKRNSIHWGDQLSLMLRNGITGLLHLPNATFHDLYNLTRRKSPESEGLRRQIVATCPDPIVRQFWEVDFLTTYKEEDTKSSRNKLLRLVSGGTVSKMLAQRSNRIDLNEIMEAGKILLVDLSELGDETRRFLGSFVLTLFVSAATGRASQGRAERKPFSIFADEAHLFVEGDAIETLIGQARKFRIRSVFAHQYLSQFQRVQIDALMNAGTVLVGRTDLNDAAYLAKKMKGQITAEEISTLPPYHMVGRIGDDVVRFQTPPNNDCDDPARLAAIIAESRRRYYIRVSDDRTCPKRIPPMLEPSVDLSYDEF